MIGVTRAQLEALAARAPSRAASVSSTAIHPARQHARSAGGDVLSRARAYIATIPGAVAGQRGHDRTFYAANRLVRGFALEPDAAYPLLAEWNQKCDPPWSEYDLRRKLEEAARQPGPRGFKLNEDPLPPGAHARHDGSHSTGSSAQFRNFTWDEVRDGETMRRVRRGRRGEELLDELVAYTGGWPRRVGKMLFVRDRTGAISWLKSANELFAWIDWQYGIDGGRGFDWQSGPGCLSEPQFLEACRIHCEAWNQVELYPHDPQITGHYYHHPELPTDADGSALTDLVRRFHPDTPEDEDLIRLFFVTLVWGGPPRKRPIFLFESATNSGEGGRGAGKTTVAVIGSLLVGGFISISPREQLRDIQTRLLSPEALTKRIALIDNLKALRFSDSDLEGLITSPVISGRQLFTGEGQRPNTLTWVVTSNKPSLSKDLAQRSIIIRVTKPVYGPVWERDVTAFIEANRWRILADCVRELHQPSRLPDDFTFSRWAEWEFDVMSKAPDPARLASELASRRASVDDDDEIAGHVADAIRGLLTRKGFDPGKDVVLIPAAVLVSEIVKVFAGEKMNPVSGMRWLYLLGIHHLRKHDASTPYRGAIWRPDRSSEDDKILTWSDRHGTSGLPD